MNEFTPIRGSVSDASGTIASGGTAQALLAADGNRSYLLIQNLHATSALWVDFDGTDAVEAKPSVKIPAGITAVWPMGGWIPRGAISIIGPTTSQSFTCKYASGVL